VPFDINHLRPAGINPLLTTPVFGLRFQKMFAAVSRCEFEIALFWSLDRSSREGVFETLQHLQRLTSNQHPGHDCKTGAGAAERVVAGLERARAQGRIGGRPIAVDAKMRAQILEMRRNGESLAEIADAFGISTPGGFPRRRQGNGHPKLN
jgi:DNA invertase Pin-like site-specific DNA recombinase